MGYFEQFKRQIAQLLAQSGQFTATEIAEEYSPLTRPGPLRRELLCVGLKEITTGGARYVGAGTQNIADRYGKELCVTASFRIYAPKAQGGGACHGVFSRLADVLLLERAGPRAQSLRCGELAYDRELCAYTLTALAVFKTTAVQEYENGAALRAVLVRHTAPALQGEETGA